MRIIERTNPVDKSILFVVQEEDYRGFTNYNNALIDGALQSFSYQKRFRDIRHFATEEEARDFMYKYKNYLGIGERLVE